MDCLTPTQVLAAKIAALEAKLQIAEERAYFLVAEISRLNAQIGNTEFRTTLPQLNYIDSGS